MSSEAPPAESSRGYLSDTSKRRFTIVAGVLGAVFFLLQILLPMLLMFAFMAPMMMFPAAVSVTDVEQAALWNDAVWLVEQTAKVNWRDPERTEGALSLQRVRLADLEDAAPAIALDAAANESPPALLGIGDRLWMIGADTVRYYENGTLTRLSGPGRPPGASRPFAHGGLPAVLLLRTPPTIATLRAQGGRAEWTHTPLTLDLPQEAGSLAGVQAVEASGRLHLVAQLCTESPAQCSLRYRALDRAGWLPLLDVCSCGSWTAIALDSSPAVVVSEKKTGSAGLLTIAAASATGPRVERIETDGGRLAWLSSAAFPLGRGVLVLSQGMPGSLKLMEIADGRIVRSVRKAGSFPFGPNMMVLMTIPQLLPIALSLVFALVLTGQMRRHRVQEYVIGGERRIYASLWQRALAQLVDIVPFAVGFAVPTAAVWRMMSDPESMVESGPAFPFLFFGLFAAAFVWALLVLVAYSYFEGRFGKTPGKWLLGIRVLGTDLQPCGFGRALLRNLLTFVDGFFNFLVGALLVALTDNWQRLGDLAARTVVVADEKPA